MLMYRNRPSRLKRRSVIVGSCSPLPTYAELRRDPLALWFPTAYSDPVDTLVFCTSFAGGDYDFPNID
jgi:hypothetical protein